MELKRCPGQALGQTRRFFRFHFQSNRRSESGIVFTRNPVTVTVHLGVWAIPDEEHGFGSGGHLSAVLSSITFELCYPLGFFDQCFVFSHWVSHWCGLAFGLLRLIELPCAEGDQRNQNEILQSHFLMVILLAIKEVGEILPPSGETRDKKGTTNKKGSRLTSQPFESW